MRVEIRTPGNDRPTRCSLRQRVPHVEHGTCQVQMAGKLRCDAMHVALVLSSHVVMPVPAIPLAVLLAFIALLNGLRAKARREARQRSLVHGRSPQALAQDDSGSPSPKPSDQEEHASTSKNPESSILPSQASATAVEQAAVVSERHMHHTRARLSSSQSIVNQNWNKTFAFGNVVNHNPVYNYMAPEGVPPDRADEQVRSTRSRCSVPMLR